MSGVSTVQEVNRELARKINEEARGNPQSPYANKADTNYPNTNYPTKNDCEVQLLQAGGGNGYLCARKETRH